MKHIKSYMSKIDTIINSNKTKRVSNGKGLLSPSEMSNKNNNPEQVDPSQIVATYVKAIREARKGIKDGK